MTKKLVNKTPHQVRILDENGCDLINLKPAQNPVRVLTNKKDLKKVAGVSVYHQVERKLINLPEPKEDTLYVVSGFALNVGKDVYSRTDLVAPDTSKESVVTSLFGDIIGVKWLVK